MKNSSTVLHNKMMIMRARYSVTSVTKYHSYTYSHDNGLQDQRINSRYPRDHAGGEVFMECNYNVSEHNSNNNEYIYGDPSHLSAEDDFLNEEDEQALRESFVFIATATNTYMVILHISLRMMISLMKKTNKCFAKALCSYQQPRLFGQRPAMWLQ